MLINIWETNFIYICGNDYTQILSSTDGQTKATGSTDKGNDDLKEIVSKKNIEFETYFKTLNEYMNEHDDKLMTIRQMMEVLHVEFEKGKIIIEEFWKNEQVKGKFIDCRTFQAFQTKYCVVTK